MTNPSSVASHQGDKSRLDTQRSYSWQPAVIPRASLLVGQRDAVADASVPLVIGITGHRDLRPEDVGQLRSVVDGILKSLKACWCRGDAQHQPPPVLLSSLAAGADQLVAQAALDLGLRLIAVLPMPQEQYERDFATEKELAGFRGLLEQASAVIEMGLCPGSSPDSLGEGAERARQYEAAGMYICRHCYVLIALWDGEEGKTGGTAEVVHMKLSGYAGRLGPDKGPLDMAVVGPVYQVVTPRLSSKPAPEIELKVHDPGKGVRAGVVDAQRAVATDVVFQSVVDHLRVYNSDLQRLRDKLASESETTAEEIVPISETPDHARAIRRRFAMVDALSNHFQTCSARIIRAYSGLLLSAGLVLGVIFYFHPLKPKESLLGTHYSLIVAYLVIILAIWGLYRWSKWADFHNKYHDYRALAEGLRVQLFWQLAGVRQSAADHYLSHQTGELAWIRCAMKAFDLDRPTAEPGDLALIRLHWVDDQKKYFTNAADRDKTAAHRYSKAGKAALFIAVPWAALKVFAKGLYDIAVAQFPVLCVPLSLLLVLLATASAAVLALFGYSHFRGFAEQAKHYTTMVPLFDRASRLLDGTKSASAPAAQAVLLQLGREALAENAYWLMLHHQRKMDLPK